MAKTNLEVIQGMYEAFSRGDLDAFLADVAPDVEWRYADSFIYGEINPVIGVEPFRKGSLRRLGEEWEAFRSPLDELIDAGDNVIGLGRYTGVHKASGRRLNAQFAHVFTFRDGKVVRWRQYTDTRQFADVAGIRQGARAA